MRRLCGLAMAAFGLGASIMSAQAVDYVAATGGTVTTYRNGVNVVTVHTFTGSGTLTVTTGGTVNYLVVGGGGGGGGKTGGGGGAGGFLTGTTTVTGTTYAVTVGAGGAGGAGQNDGSNGGDSVFASVTAIGGGGGAENYDPPATGHAGGSGGGSSVFATTPQPGGAGTLGQGNDGGGVLSWNNPCSAGGGGGAGAVGVSGDSFGGPGAAGGAGLSSTITDGVTPTWYAGGGGGGNYTGRGGAGAVGGGGTGGDIGLPGISGKVNTGGGGGGSGQNRDGAVGSGGFGIVIISYVSGVTNDPYSSHASLTVNQGVATALSAGNFGYVDPSSTLLTAVKITSLPALGTLKYNGATITTLPLTVAAANIGNLTYQSAGPVYGSGAAFATIGIEVENANSVWSLPAVMTVNVTPNIVVQDNSFESTGDWMAGDWGSFNNTFWSRSAAYPYERIDTLAADGTWSAQLANSGVSYSQDLRTTVNAGDTLSVTFSATVDDLWQAPNTGKGKFDVTFKVDGTPYTQTFDLSEQTPNTWVTNTFTQVVANSGNLTIGFSEVDVQSTADRYDKWNAGRNQGAGNVSRSFIDHISDITVTAAGPPPGTYGSWALANGASSDPLADSNSNGVANGIEFFMGGTLASPATLPPLVDNAGTWSWTIPYDKNAAASYYFDVSAELLSWTPLTTGASAIEVLSGPDEIRLTLPSGMRFVRLVVTSN